MFKKLLTPRGEDVLYAVICSVAIAVIVLFVE